MTRGEDQPLIVIVDDETIILELLHEVMSQRGFRVEGFGSVEAALPRLRASLPDLLLTDLSLPERSGLELIQSARSLPGGTAMPIVLMSAHFCNGVPAGFRENSGADLLLAKPFKSILNIPTILRELLPSVDEDGADAAPTDEAALSLPDPASLASLARAWRMRSTGIVRHRKRRVARLQRGDPLTAQEHAALLNTLYDGELTFGLEPVKPGEPTALGAALFSAALRLAEASPIAEQLDHVLVELQGAERVSELPLSPAMRRLLNTSGLREASLSERLSSAGVSLEDCAPELAALILLGVLGLRAAVSAAKGPPSSPTAALALRELRRELRQLEEEDDYTALGVDEGSDAALVERSYERQRAHYARMASDSALGQTVQDLAQQVLIRLKQAQQRIADTAPMEHESDREALLFSRGCVALEAKRFEQAVWCFRAARVFDRSSPRTLGYLGWAILNDPQREETARWQEGLAMLKVSLSLAPGDVTCQRFLAEAEQIIGEAALAELQKALGDPTE